MAREKVLPIRLSADELEAIRKAAYEDDRTISDFMRLTVLRAIGVKPRKPKRKGRR